MTEQATYDAEHERIDAALSIAQAELKQLGARLEQGIAEAELPEVRAAAERVKAAMFSGMRQRAILECARRAGYDWAEDTGATDPELLGYLDLWLLAFERGARAYVEDSTCVKDSSGDY